MSRLFLSLSCDIAPKLLLLFFPVVHYSFINFCVTRDGESRIYLEPPLVFVRHENNIHTWGIAHLREDFLRGDLQGKIASGSVIIRSFLRTYQSRKIDERSWGTRRDRQVLVGLSPTAFIFLGGVCCLSPTT